MRIDKVITTIDDGAIDSIGGVHYDYQPYAYPEYMEFRIKATTDDANIVISFSGDELNKLHKILKSYKG